MGYIGFRVQGLGLGGVEDMGFRLLGLRFKVEGSGYGVQGCLRLGPRV